MHQYFIAKFKVLAKNAAEKTVAMINKEVSILLPKCVKEKLDLIDIGHDTQAQVMFSIATYFYSLYAVNKFWIPIVLVYLYYWYN